MACLNLIADYFILICITLTCIIACNNSGPENKTEVFERYLNKEFKEGIPEKQHLYYIVPRVSCKGCRKKVYSLTDKIAKNENATLIMSGRALQVDLMLEETRGIPNMKVDSMDNISSLNFGISNTMIIITENGGIKDILEIKAKTNVPDLLQKFEAENTLHVGS